MAFEEKMRTVTISLIARLFSRSMKAFLGFDECGMLMLVAGMWRSAECSAPACLLMDYDKRKSTDEYNGIKYMEL